MRNLGGDYTSVLAGVKEYTQGKAKGSERLGVSDKEGACKPEASC